MSRHNPVGAARRWLRRLLVSWLMMSWLLGLAVLSAPQSIAQPIAQPIAQSPADPVIFAAASLKTALDQIAADQARETGQRWRISYAASSALARQIEAGAPADLFLSADLDWMDYLEQRRLLRPGTRSTLLGNRLVLIAPGGARSAIPPVLDAGTDLRQALGVDGRLAIADPGSVPAGKYGKAALSGLGLWPQVEGRLAPAENVRAALLLVVRGEAPLGLVYETDAAEAGVAIVSRIPTGSHPPILYPVAIPVTARHPDAAAILHRLRTPAALARFRAAGFQIIE